MSILKKLVTYLKKNGLLGLFQRLILSLVQKIFMYEPWHNAPYSTRPYAVAVVNYLNCKKVKDEILEIGCGTGDILRRVEYKKKLAYDFDANALRGLKFFEKIKNVGGTIKTCKFDIKYEELAGKFDAILMINWIHNIEPTLLEKKISDFFLKNLKDNGEIIIDTVGQESYKYNHDINSLTQGLNCKVIKLGEYEFRREIYSIKKLSRI